MSTLHIQKTEEMPDLPDDGREREWWVFSTCLGTCELMLTDGLSGAFGVVKNPTKEEWSAAFSAPSNPYRWRDNSRVSLKMEGKE